MKINLRSQVLLGCDAASSGNWFPVSPENMVILCSESKHLIKISSDILTLEDETTTSSRNGCGAA
jgi:hypothetical protein